MPSSPTGSTETTMRWADPGTAIGEAHSREFVEFGSQAGTTS